MSTSELKQIFDFVQKNGWSNARQIGKAIPGGKSRANHFLYGYQDILFVKRGIAPPQWRVASNDAYSAMLGRISPKPVTPRALGSSSSFTPAPQPDFLRLRELPMISVCESCGLPIQPTGKCGCS